jgi:hypothetical protein
MEWVKGKLGGPCALFILVKDTAMGHTLGIQSAAAFSQLLSCPPNKAGV